MNILQLLSPVIYTQKSESPPLFKGFLQYKLWPGLDTYSANPHKDHICDPVRFFEKPEKTE